MTRVITYIIMAIIISMPATSIAQEVQAQSMVNLMFLAERMDTSQLKGFAEQHETRINPIFYTSSYLMMLRVRQEAETSAIDVVSTQLHNQNALKSCHGLEPLNHELLPNLKYMDQEFLRASAQDPNNNYTIPITGGVMCLLVNQNLIRARDITSYADLWRPDLKGKVLIPEDMGTLMQLTMKVMRYASAEPEQAQVGRAWEKMCRLAENSQLVTNNAVDFLQQDSEIALALVCCSDAVRAMRNNPNLVMITPSEGYMCWVEAVSIPVNAKHKDLAHAYINYIMQPQILAEICVETGLVPMSSEAYAIVKQQGGPGAIISPAELVQATTGQITQIPGHEQYQAMWHNVVEDKQFLY